MPSASRLEGCTRAAAVVAWGRESQNLCLTHKREESRQRMAALRRARRSPAAVRKEQRAASLFGDASKWRIRNLAQVLSAMADSVGK